MRSLPISLTQELSKEVASIGHLIKIVLFNPVTHTDIALYYTDKDFDVFYDDGTGVHTYLSRGIEFDGGQQNLTPKVDSISFTIDNVALEFSSYVMNYDTRGRECTIYRAAFNDQLQVLGAAPLFPGVLDRVSIEPQKATFDVLNFLIRWNTLTPRRKHIATCPWTFKDSVTCRYVGALTTCDKSWDACVTRANTVNFGGFRWLTGLQDRRIMWGRI